MPTFGLTTDAVPSTATLLDRVDEIVIGPVVKADAKLSVFVFPFDTPVYLHALIMLALIGGVSDRRCTPAEPVCKVGKSQNRGFGTLSVHWQ